MSGWLNYFFTEGIKCMNDRALKAYIFYCSNNLEASQFSSLNQGEEEGAIKAISLPCSGKVDIPYLIKAFEYGADGVVIVTCKKDECRHFEGNLRAHKRAEAVEALLEEIGVTTGRMAVFECGKQDIPSVLGEIRQFMEKIKKLPPLNT
jgi:F420-non-reducing hydrogenase iron-sulfur subunit